MKKLELNKKTKEELENLSTKRLLAYYKSERKRMIQYESSQTCYCCGSASWHLYNDEATKNAEKKYNEWKAYLETIKSVLNTREHVINKWNL